MYVDFENENIKKIINLDKMIQHDIIKIASTGNSDECVCALIQLGLVDHEIMINLTKMYGVSHTVKEEIIEYMYMYSPEYVDKCCRNAAYSTESIELIRTIVKYGSFKIVKEYVSFDDIIIRCTVIDRFPVLVPIKYLLDAQASNNSMIKMRLINSGLFVYDLSEDPDEDIAAAAEMYLNKKGGAE